MKKKILLVGAMMVLVALAAVGITMAYLTSQNTATNTFTVGKVAITLDEAAVNENGELLYKDGKLADRVQGNVYHLMPGHEYVKDPTVTVEAGSEESYIRMLVEVENIDSLKSAITGSGYYAENGVFLLEKLVTGWNGEKWVYYGYTDTPKTVDGKEIKCGVYEFRYAGTVTVGDTDNKALEPLFRTITVPVEVNADQLPTLANVKINVIGQAIQADGFDTADAAWKAFAN